MAGEPFIKGDSRGERVTRQRLQQHINDALAAESEAEYDVVRGAGVVACELRLARGDYICRTGDEISLETAAADRTHRFATLEHHHPRPRSAVYRAVDAEDG